MSLKEILKNAQGVPTGEYKKIAGGTMYADSPIGSILPYGGTTAPSGWMICNGASLLRTDYAELFAVIGTAFGSADSTHFNIPDLRGEFLRGAGTNSHSGQGSGGSVGQHQNATTLDNNIMEQSTHRLVKAFSGDANYNDVTNADSSSRTGLTGSAYFAVEQAITGVYTSHITTRPTNTSVNYIIKAKMIALPADFDSAVNAKIAAKGVYSTSEVDTGKTWIDGKPIYRKAFGYTSVVTTGNSAMIGTIDNMADIINIQGTFRNSNDNNCFPIGYTFSNNSGVVAQNFPFVLHANGKMYANAFGFDIKNINVVIEYTKTA